MLITTVGRLTLASCTMDIKLVCWVVALSTSNQINVELKISQLATKH